MNDLPKQRPKTRYFCSFMGEDPYTEDDIPIKTIYVGNLSSEITENEVKEYFLKFGSVASVAIKRTSSKRSPWFYAFVTFETTESAAKALDLEKHEILSRGVVVNAADSWNQPKEKDATCITNNVSRDEASEMEFRLLHLNDDCLYHIASYLEHFDLINLSKTCKRLECCVKPLFGSYKKLDIDSLRYRTLAAVREILYKIGPHVQHIVCTHDFELNERRFEQFLKKYCVAANVVSLEFHHTCSLSKRLIQTFKNLKTLKCHITDEMSAVLSKCSNLQNLDLCGSKNYTVKHLNKLSNLQNLSLAFCSNLRAECLKDLCMKRKFVSLNIVGCKRLHSSSIETLAGTQTRLETLSISNNYQTSNLSPLATLKNMKRLCIDCYSKNCDEFFQELAKHRGAELEVLVISRCPFNHEVEQAIYSLKKLKVLALNGCENITSMFFTKMAVTSLVCLFIFPLEAIVEEDILNLISKSETIKVIALDTNHRVATNKRPLVLSAYEIIKKKERKYPWSLFTLGPCIIDGILHEEPKLDRSRTEYWKIIKKLGYLGQLARRNREHSHPMEIGVRLANTDGNVLYLISPVKQSCKSPICHPSYRPLEVSFENNAITNDLPKQRPKTLYYITFVGEDGCEENVYTEDDIPIKTIYVGHLSSEITENEVKEYFLEFGTVTSVAIERTRLEREPCFHAFVTFEKMESWAKALCLAKHEILSRRVVVQAAGSWIQPKEKDAKCKRSQFLLLDLNDDCLHHIASYLELRDFFNLSKTCKRLEGALEPLFASYKELDIDSLDGLALAAIREVLYKIGPHVQHIICTQDFELNGRRSEKLLKKYFVAANVVSLTFYRACSLSKRLIQTFKNLKTLSCPLTDDMSAVLSNYSNLQNLDLSDSPDLTGKHLDKLSNLQTLSLHGCSNLQPEFFKNLCMKTKLVSLNIERCTLLDYSSFETLARTQTKLETLSICDNYETSNLSPLATLKNLKRLRIDCSNGSCDEFFQELAKHHRTELEVLVVWNCSFNHEAEQAIYSLQKLKALAVYGFDYITSMFFTNMAKSSLECLAIEPLESLGWFPLGMESIVEEGILNFISKSETIKVIALDTKRRVKQRLVLSAHEIIKKKERKYPLSLFTIGPCIIDGIFHEEPELGPRKELLNKIEKYIHID